MDRAEASPGFARGGGGPRRRRRPPGSHRCPWHPGTRRGDLALRAFTDLGADILFLEAPRDEAEMARGCREVPGVHMANLLAGGSPTPDTTFGAAGRAGLSPSGLPAGPAGRRRGDARGIGEMAAGQMPGHQVDFATLRALVGFDAYDRLLDACATPSASTQPTPEILPG